MTENEAFNEIYGKYKNLVLKVAYTYVGDLDTAEDIMQDTFLALYRDMEEKGIESEEEYSNIKSWLFTTAKHRALNWCKKSAKTIVADMVESSDVIGEPFSESLESEYLDRWEEKRRTELHGRILASLMEKNLRWYEAILMVYCLEIPVPEAAARLGMNENAFYGMMYRARNWIHKNFNVEYEELKQF